MGATNTKQMKFASSLSQGEGQNMNCRSEQGLQQGRKSWEIGQSQNLRHGRSNEQDPIAAAADCCDNMWRKSKERHKEEGAEKESLETGFQLGGVCGYQDFGWSKEQDNTSSDEEEFQMGRKLPLQVSRKLPMQVEKELPIQVSRRLPIQVDQELPIQVKQKLPMQVDRREPVQFMTKINRNGVSDTC